MTKTIIEEIIQMKNLAIRCQRLGMAFSTDTQKVASLHSLLQEALFQRSWLADTGEDMAFHDLLVDQIRQQIRVRSKRLHLN